MSQLTDSLTAIAAAAAILPRDSATLAGLPEDELLAIPALFADITRQLEPSMAATAGEIARRSSVELGYAGLAQKGGFRTAEKLVQHLTGTTSREAAKLVRTGVIIHEAEIITEAERTGDISPELTKPWLAPVGRAVPPEPSPSRPGKRSGSGSASRARTSAPTSWPVQRPD